jgi:hypothetical protein
MELLLGFVLGASHGSPTYCQSMRKQRSFGSNRAHCSHSLFASTLRGRQCRKLMLLCVLTNRRY